MEMPAIASSTYSSTPLNMQAMLAGQGLAPAQANLLIHAANQAVRAQPIVQPAVHPKEKKSMSNARRLVQVFIADPNENVPLADCLLYKGDLKLTDATDQELFFEVDIKSILDAHNEKRAKMVDKAVKERTEFLEPTRIRDLKMTVVTVASF